jgi:hypothetical protein
MNNVNKLEVNNSIPLTNYTDLKTSLGGKWVEQDTAVLIIHGIGNQHPLETLDGFARGLVETYQEAGYSLTIEHQLARKTSSDSRTPWFDNVLRIRQGDTGPCLDVYEYYWANETEGQATFRDLSTWLNNVTSGARKFYKNNIFIAQTHKDESVFISNGKFNSFSYWFCVYFVPHIFVFLNWVIEGLYTLLSSIPVLGPIIAKLFHGQMDGTLDKISNVLNDISIYNTTDAKSKFFKIRNCILDGAVDALRFLLEARPTEGTNKLTFQYSRVLLAGHSLGSQVAFDAINRINHLVNQGEIKGYDKKGKCTIVSESAQIGISERLIGLVTFGSPLDKVAFFFREQVPDSEYLRSQIINNFHGFKQRNWTDLHQIENKLRVKPCEERLFENISWRNYWDARDYVSGSLDYYEGVVNIKCEFPSKWHSFTHSRYWSYRNMYAEIIEKFFYPKHIISDRQISKQVPELDVSL